ncbi:MAG: mannose-1-phosphate guanylyltransferase [Planctomycetota bacterium]
MILFPVMNTAVIMAGGSGTRLWPLSRRSKPKQLLKLFNGRSLLEEAFDRVARVVPPEHIYVIALAEHIPAIAAALPKIPATNLIGEPVGRDTANAVALAAALLHHKNPDTIMGVFTADHLIRPADQFAEIVQRGYDAAAKHPDALITFGIKPTEPHTGMGYVQRGDPISPGLHNVRAFKEKPTHEIAKSYLASGDYFWNSGMFVWRTSTILDQLHIHLPDTHRAITALAETWSTPAGQSEASRVYPTLKKTSIDFAVMEKAPRVLMVEMNLEWLDVGHWSALPAVLGADANGNTTSALRTLLTDSRSNIIVSECNHLIVTIGVDDLVIVHSPDATLICRWDKLDEIKDMATELNRQFPNKYT